MEYIQGLPTQARLFGYSVLLGVALGVLYCVFRFLRYLFANKTWACVAADVIWFLLCGVAVLFFNIVADEGRLRFYTVFGVFFGAAVFYLVSAKLSIRICSVTVKGLKIIILLIKAPFKFLKRKIMFLFKKTSELCRKRQKKISKNSKNRLQKE